MLRGKHVLGRKDRAWARTCPSLNAMLFPASYDWVALVTLQKLRLLGILTGSRVNIRDNDVKEPGREIQRC